MTWEMYQRLHDICEEVDADDAVRVLVLKGAGGKAFVAGTDIGQFTEFKGGEDGLRYERDGDRAPGGSRGSGKPVIAQIQGYAVGGGFGIAAGADIRVATPDARFGAPIARTLGNCLSMQAYARYVDLLGPSRFKELIFTARLMPAEEALAAGFVHEIVAAEAIEARVRELAETIASHAPITLWVTKEAVRRIQEARARARRRRPDRRRPTAAPTSTKACAPSSRSARRAGPASSRDAPRPGQPIRSAS